MSKPDTIDEILNQFVNHELQVAGGVYTNEDPMLSFPETKAALSAMVDGDVIGNDAKCEKNHEEYFDWCSYCDVERVKSELRAEQRQRAIAKGFTL
jgi:hypothetical protein